MSLVNGSWLYCRVRGDWTMLQQQVKDGGLAEEERGESEREISLLII